MTSGGYQTSFDVELPEVFAAAASGPRPKKIVYISGKGATLPNIAVALQRNGDAQIVSEGPLSDESIIYQETLKRRDRPPALVRMTMLDEPLRADLEVPLPAKPGEDAALAAARKLVAGSAAASSAKPSKSAAAKPSKVAAPPSPAAKTQPPGLLPDAVYAEQTYPSRQLRLLALFRFWNVIHYFYPYLHLMGNRWDRALIEAIPRFEDARDAREYGLAVAELAARIPDTHVGVSGSAALDEEIGVAGLGVIVQRIEGQPAVTAIRNEAARTAGLAIGDVIVSVDGEAFEARAQRLGKYIAASNPWGHALRADATALRGASGSTATLVVRGKDDKPREVRIQRVATPPRATGEPYKLLEGLRDGKDEVIERALAFLRESAATK